MQTSLGMLLDVDPEIVECINKFVENKSWACIVQYSNNIHNTNRIQSKHKIADGICKCYNNQSDALS